jgi:hypothetical protein
MPWPEQIGALLARSDSRAGQALRWGLCGLRAALQAALEEVPHDPGHEDLRGLLSELNPLLSLPAPTLPPNGPAALPPAESISRAESADTPRLLPLAHAVASDPQLRGLLQITPLREESDDAIWNDVQRLLLRLPPALAADWRRRCQSHAEQVGGRLDESRAAVLPLGRDETIYPGLSGTVQVDGLRSADAAPLDPRVLASPEQDLRFLAGAISTYLWFIERGSPLCHCLRSVFRFGVVSLTGDQRPRYLAELLRIWERVRLGGSGPRGNTAGHGWKDWLKDRLDLDEALQSLLYRPPADPASWWGQLQSRTRDVLFQARDRAVQAGCPVHLQLLGGSFAEINRLAPDSLQVDFGAPGEVAACPRVWARVDGEEIKGRVLYRSPQEDV